MARVNSGKQQRLKLKVARSTVNSVNDRTDAGATTVTDTPGHDFRIRGEHSDLVTVFHVRESQFEIDKRIAAARTPIHAQSLHSSLLYTNTIAIPLRTQLNRRRVTAKRLAEAESAAFEAYLSEVYAKFPPTRLNHFEHNLNVWRQLWRVCELSDVLLLSADARHPLFHFPPSLYEYVTADLKKPLILVLNKIDLIEADALAAWTSWFALHYPLLRVVPFTSSPHEHSPTAPAGDMNKRVKERKKREGTGDAYGVDVIMSIFDEFVRAKLNANKQTTLGATSVVASDGSAHEESDSVERERLSELTSDADHVLDSVKSKAPARPTRESIVIVGLIGHPNAGKVGREQARRGQCVVSATPGHTKHLQTLPMTEHLALVDCPGLVFPAIDMPRPLQVVCGIYPLSALREPYSAVQYAAERIPLWEMYGLHTERERVKQAQKQQQMSRQRRKADADEEKLNDDADIERAVIDHSDQSASDSEWSAMLICELYARQHGYTVKGNDTFDTYRAAQEMLHDILVGRVALRFLPPIEDPNVNIKP